MKSENWVLDHTLSKSKPFYWKIDEDGNITIKRHFKNKTEEQEIPLSDLIKLQAYLNKDNWTDLANNVEKLRLYQEKEGLGRFMYENLGMDETGAQLASHLGAIFTNAGVWLYNGKKKNMQFKKNLDNWVGSVKDYYSESD